MLEFCARHYGIRNCFYLYPALKLLIGIAESLYPSGYQQHTPVHFNFSNTQLHSFFNMPHTPYSEAAIREVFRYASLFKIINNTIISPDHIEWSFNPFYQRDLFFVKLKLETRETKNLPFMI
ncbi:MAG: hypothetical protein ACRCTQ_05325 [Brevinemataceae bacterium]